MGTILGLVHVKAVRYLALTTIVLTLALGTLPATSEAEADKPIIAQLFAHASEYDGRSVTIYGLVIETNQAGREFLLQDVSQMPLRIVRSDGLRTLEGDQILVQGVFVANHGNPYLKAEKITYTQVLGGGGCC